MDINSIFSVLFGSTFGLSLRIFIQNNYKIKIGFNIQNTSLINFLASFFLGLFVTWNPINKDLSLLFYAGFLGSFSTFSSFIYQLFILIKQGKFIRTFLHYFEVISLSLFLFYLGCYFIKFFK